MNSKLISVIMCVYNEKPNDLKAAIESVLDQTYACFEFLILIEASTSEELVGIVNEYKMKDGRIRVFVNTERLGFPRTLNLGIKYSTGEYIARMDADDISSKNRFKLQVDYLNKNSDVSLVSGNYVLIDERGGLIRNNLSFENIDFSIKRLMSYGNVIAHPCVMVRRKDLIEMGGYRDLKAAEDYDLWLRMLINNKKMHVINKGLLKYRIRRESGSNRNRIALRLTTRLLRKRFKSNRTISLKEINRHIEKTMDGMNIDRILKSYILYDNSWIKLHKGNIIGFIKDLIHSLIMNKDNINELFDSLKFNYNLNKAKYKL